MSRIFALLILLTLSACKSDDTDVIDLKDIIPTSDYDEQKSMADTEEIDSIHPKHYFRSSLLDSLGLQFSKVQKIDELIFPDRFRANYSLKLALIQIDTTYFRKWNFGDSIKTEAAFYNWLDCFGEKCKGAKVGQSVNLQKKAFVLLMQDSLIIQIEHQSKIPYNKWIEYYTKTTFENWKYIIYQPAHGKTQWFRVHEKELIKL